MNQFHQNTGGFHVVARPGLESIRTMLAHLGNPERGLRFVHVAGTNGKGSVCAFLQSVLTAEGYVCGKYTSPNLICVCERISIDGKEIEEAEMKDLLSLVEEAAQKTKAALGTAPTQFEIWTAAAFCYFEKKRCDYVVLETGLGGERDATNVISKAEVNVITRIAMDHKEYLGDTIEAVAKAKAGILKATTVTLAQEDAAMRVLCETCRKRELPLIRTGHAKVQKPCGMCECIDYNGMEELILGIPGYHQIENALLATEAALYLGISEKAIREGLKNARNPGRLEQLANGLIFDGAHNPNGMEALLFSLKRYFPNKPMHFWMGCMADKEVEEELCMIQRVYPNALFSAVTVRDNPRAMKAEVLAKKARACGLAAECRETISTNTSEEEMQVVCGSLYLYGQAKNAEKVFL